jgi:FAD/FMN-containing dehydrogenase/Fe-S oxidoreductase
MSDDERPFPGDKPECSPISSADRLDEDGGRRLVAELTEAVRGEVLFDSATRAIYATDSSNYRQVPIGVVCPMDEADVIEALRVCRAFGAPVLGRGAGTSLAGQGCNVAVVFDMSKHMNHVLELDPVRRIARVEPGVVLDDLRASVEVHGMTFGPDPATHAWCTIGGMVGNNSCGTHALYAGKTVDNVERLTVITYAGARIDVGPADAEELEQILAEGGEKGRIYAELKDLSERYGALVRSHFPDIPRRVSGYNLDELLPERGFHVARSLVGSESTCALVTEATLILAPSPPHRRLVILGFADVYLAADSVPYLLRHPLLGLEGFDEVLVRQMRAAGLNTKELDLLPEGAGWLLAEVGGSNPSSADARVEALLADLPEGATAIPYALDEDQRAVWRVRDSALAAAAHPPGEARNHEGWEDAAVAPEKLGTYLRGIRQLWAEFGYSGAWYGHFGQGCVHTRNDFDFSSAEGLAKFRAYVERAADLCVGLGGSLSGEHGDGQARGELLEKMFGAELIGAFRDFKAIWDPQGRMNPGKLVDALPLDANIRYGPTYRTSSLVPAYFSFADDDGSIQVAAERCVGVGRCRRDDTGVMCPSYRVTRDEKHSTRGRAKLFAEMFQGEVTPESWRNKDVLSALDLCLSCKGCAVDCPMRVDMATYKAEFLSHYYARRLRPASAYALGLIPWSARIATRLPGAANAVLQGRTLGRVVKRLGGLSTKRPAPRFATVGFRRSAVARRAAEVASPTVVLWPDTFSDVYEPGRAAATLAMLEAAGERVAVPRSWGCCGRPLYDMGMLDLAKRTLRRVLDILDPWTSLGLPIVVPEPSCLATFKDELPRLLADDPRARRLSESARSLSEHLCAIGWEPKQRVSGQRVLVHPHCHQRAAIGTDADRAVLERAGFSVEILDAGCCGLAGSFGFRVEHDAISRRIAETKFLPALQDLDPEVALIIDGFSCRTQAQHLQVRTGSSLAELLLESTRTSTPG